MGSDFNNNDTETKPAQIEFIQMHQPVLKTGDYIITVEQKIQTVNDQKLPQKIPATTFQTQKKFNIAGERFLFSPSLINSVFPPEGSLGDHFNVFPHIILNRSTLPWERNADKNREDIPWLAILLFDDAEAVRPKIMTLGELLKPSDNEVKWSGIDLEAGQSADDKVSVIEVKKSLLENIMPTQSDLSWLAHVRQGKNINGVESGDELAAVIGNRLPRKGGISNVHLVSVEDRYIGGEFDYQNAKPDDLIRLVSLKSWNFACVDNKQNFKGLLENLHPFNNAGFDQRQSALRIPYHADVSPEAENYLAAGAAALPHFLRQGDKTVSWFHGPLIPGENSNNSYSLPARTADELLRYNVADGMFDVSYSAAWELGRLLALQNKKISTGIYQWKRIHAQKRKLEVQFLLHSHLPGQEQQSQNSVEMPEDLLKWFDGLSLLQDVPFNYLVPDEQMLPNESIRFFQLDKLWIDCLLDGAFSIGRVTNADYRQDQAVNESPANNRYEKISGCLVRSDVVSGWSGLLADAYDDVYNSDPDKIGIPLKLLRMERLSPNVLLCLFSGELKRVEFHLKPESLNFGLDVYEIAPFGFYKTLRNEKGEHLNDTKGNSVKIEIGGGSEIWRQESQRILNINNLAIMIRTALTPSPKVFTSAHLALQMIEGVEKVIFQIG